MALEETWWHQRSRAIWLQNGDKNTKYFYMKANQRKRKNRIERIQDDSGLIHYDPNNIEVFFIDYFKTIFTSQNPINLDDTVQVVQNNLTVDMQNFLNEPFTKEEVFQAIFSMKSLAASGPDGLPALFYQHYWSTIGLDITASCLDIMNHGGGGGPYLL